MNLYLHIGTEKTGTTSVQKFMHVNRDPLQLQGVLYPLAPGVENHVALAALAKEVRGELWDKLGIADKEGCQRFRDALREKLEWELSTKSYRTVVMSGEHCSSRLRADEEVKRLHDFLRPFFENIYIIVYLRRQDDFLMSTYSTDVKNGSSHALQPPDEETLRFRYDYWKLTSRWSRIFGRQQVICRRYGRNFLVAGDIVDDFLFAVGLEQSPEFERPKSLNESLDAECLEFLRLLNGHLHPAGRGPNVVAALQAISHGPLVDLPPEMLENFMGAVRRSNRLVAAEYFDGQIAETGDPLFGPRTNLRRVHGPSLSPERAVEIAAILLMNVRGQRGRQAGSTQTPKVEKNRR